MHKAFSTWEGISLHRCLGFNSRLSLAFSIDRILQASTTKMVLWELRIFGAVTQTEKEEVVE